MKLSERSTLISIRQTDVDRLTRKMFCKNLAKLTGSAVRINSKKPKGKKKMKEKKKTGGSHGRI